jgi:DNA-binding transcriptional MerR regulator
MKTITAIARLFGLSRSTLLYYDRIGLLTPSYRTQAEARLYSDEEEGRLARIVTFRRAGIPLETIKTMLESDVPEKVNESLETRLREIQGQIAGLRAQQQFVVEMLRQAVLRGEEPKRTRDQWVDLMKACSFNEADMRAWHMALERDDPKAHDRFLRRIGLRPAEIERIREHCRSVLTVSPGQPDASKSAARPKRRL